jgi:hypothetical protein
MMKGGDNLRNRHRCKDNIKMDVKEIKCKMFNRILVVRGTDLRPRGYENLGSIKMGNFFSS